MTRKEQFAAGVGFVTSALAFILSKSLAWFIFIFGSGLILDFYLRDLIWGADRLTLEQIHAMPAEEYKNRVHSNFKTEWWVNWRIARYDAFKKQMRKLAREVVIFMLLSPLIFSAGRFAFLYDGLHKSPAIVHSLSDVPRVAVGKLGALDPSEPAETSPRFVRIDPPPGYSEVSPPTISLVEQALLFGLYGFPAGVGFWLLYRATRFAIKG